MVLTKKLVEDDVDRVMNKYIEVSSSLIGELENSDSVGEWREILYNHAAPGADISFAMMYDWAVKFIVNKLLEGHGRRKKKEDEEEISLRKVQKEYNDRMRLSGELQVLRGYTKKEELLLKRLVKNNMDIDSIYAIYTKSYDGKSRDAIASKIVRLKQGEPEK